MRITKLLKNMTDVHTWLSTSGVSQNVRNVRSDETSLAMGETAESAEGCVDGHGEEMLDWD